MGENKHTAGPWTAFHCEYEEAWKVRDQIGCIITDCGMSDMTLETDAANAHLIAAAPEMFEALEEMIPRGLNADNPNISDDMIVPVDMTMGEIRRAHAALAKAKGASE